MTKLLRTVIATAALVASAAVAHADTVLDWNAIAVAASGGNPFNQARILATTQLAVFEAVNAIEGGYEPYLGTIVAPTGASVDAAVITAAHGVLLAMAPGSATMVNGARVTSLAAIPDGPAKDGGIATGEAAAAAMLAARFDDGAVPAQFYVPTSSAPYQWQLTPSCSALGGVLANWRYLKPFGIASAADFRAEPPPALTSVAYAKAYNEVMTVGRKVSDARPQDRTDVALFYAGTSPGYIMNMAARQIAAAQGRSLAENARALALINMAISDSAVASFETKYTYKTWRPETAIHNAHLDGNARTDADGSWEPLITAPCVPAYTSNHASLSSGGAEVLRRLYGEGEHAITIRNPEFPSLVYHYTTFNEILSDIDDARVYGGIHFRFDQDEGGRLGRAVATAVYKGNLRKTSEPQ